MISNSHSLQYLLTIKVANFGIVILLQHALQNVEQNVARLVVMVRRGAVMAVIVVEGDARLLLDLFFVLVGQHLLEVLRPCHEEDELIEFNITRALMQESIKLSAKF